MDNSLGQTISRGKSPLIFHYLFYCVLNIWCNIASYFRMEMQTARRQYLQWGRENNSIYQFYVRKLLQKERYSFKNTKAGIKIWQNHSSCTCWWNFRIPCSLLQILLFNYRKKEEWTRYFSIRWFYQMLHFNVLLENEFICIDSSRSKYKFAWQRARNAWFRRDIKW